MLYCWSGVTPTYLLKMADVEIESKNNSHVGFCVFDYEENLEDAEFENLKEKVIV